MQYIKVKGKREPISVAEWSDIRRIVEQDLVKNKEFFKELAEL